jgi:hypothetical protein
MDIKYNVCTYYVPLDIIKVQGYETFVSCHSMFQYSDGTEDVDDVTGI